MCALLHCARAVLAVLCCVVCSIVCIVLCGLWCVVMWCVCRVVAPCAVLCCAVSAGRGRTGPLPAVCWTHPAAVEQWGGPRSTLTNWSCVCATRQCACRTAGCGLGVLFPLCAVTAVQVSFVSPMCGLSVPNAGLKRNTFVCVTTKKKNRHLCAPTHTPHLGSLPAWPVSLLLPQRPLPACAVCCTCRLRRTAAASFSSCVRVTLFVHVRPLALLSWA